MFSLCLESDLVNSLEIKPFDEHKQHLSKLFNNNFTPHLGDPRMIIGENPKKVFDKGSLRGNHVILTVNFLLCNFIDLWKDSRMSSILRHVEFLERAIIRCLPISLHSFLFFNYSLCLLLSHSFYLLSLNSSS